MYRKRFVKRMVVLKGRATREVYRFASWLRGYPLVDYVRTRDLVGQGDYVEIDVVFLRPKRGATLPQVLCRLPSSASMEEIKDCFLKRFKLLLKEVGFYGYNILP